MGSNIKFKIIENLENIMERYLLLVVLILFCFGISFITPNFLTIENFFNIFRQGSIIGIISIGTTFVIIGAGFDISVGSILAFTAALTIGLQYSMHWSLAVFVVIGIGGFIGFLNGFLTVKVGIPSIIVTLSTMTIIRGVVYLYTDGYPFTLVEGAHPDFIFLGQGSLGFIPFPVVILFFLVFSGQWVLSKTRLGRYICAIGGNRDAALHSGISVDKIQIITFLIGGVMAAVAGVIYSSRLLSVSPLAGQGYEMDAIAATVIGGTSVLGGEGSIFKTLIGVLLLSIINNVFNLIGIPMYSQYVIKGIIILVAVGLDSYRKKNHGK